MGNDATKEQKGDQNSHQMSLEPSDEHILLRDEWRENHNTASHPVSAQLPVRGRSYKTSQVRREKKGSLLMRLRSRTEQGPKWTRAPATGEHPQS